MQYYLNGFKPGDPTDLSGARSRNVAPALVDLPENLDVLIVGCGPAGLTLAAQLAAFPDITTRIVEQKSGPLDVGQADGISGRSSEIFQALGFVDRVMNEAYFLKAITFWKHDESRPENIVRTVKKPDGRDVFSEFPHVVLNQARVHEFLLDTMRKSVTRLEPDYCRRLVELDVDWSKSYKPGDISASDPRDRYPVAVTLERLDPAHAGKRETVRARYVVGCDGARSTVRSALSVHARGDSANKAWGVMDLLVVTDFPDIRIKSIIQSAHEGNLLIIPREGGHLVRFYIEMDQLRESERVSTLNITSDRLIAAAKRILHPYSLEVKEIAWWSVYEIGQRVCDAFDNGLDDSGATRAPNVFIAGDACHTHSPKAGQGMNVSIHDSFNLGWKLASVIRRQSTPDILLTYAQERRAVAEELIAFDRELAQMFSVPAEASSASENRQATPTALQDYMIKHDGYVSGTLNQYAASVICAETRYQQLARTFEVGKRFHSAPVIRFADARPVHLGHVVEADGRWRIFAFAATRPAASGRARIHELVSFLFESGDSPIRKYTAPDQDIDAVIEVIAIFQDDYRELDIASMPDALFPPKGKYNLRDYEKVYCPDFADGEDIFDSRGIDRENGCLVVVRPDQHVAHVLPLDGFAALGNFFDGFMRPPGKTSPGSI